VGYVDTKPYPTAKRRKLIYVLKNPPDVLSHLVRTLASSFSLEKLKKWWDTLRQRFPSETSVQLTLFENNISLEDLYKKCFEIWIGKEQRCEGEKSPKKDPFVERRNPTFSPDVKERPRASLIFRELEALLREQFEKGTEQEFEELVMKAGDQTREEEAVQPVGARG